MNAHIDALKTLGLTSGASSEAIKAAFRKRARETHPDHNPGSTSEEFIKVHLAYKFLSDNLNVGDQDKEEFHDTYEDDFEQPYKSEYESRKSNTAAEFVSAYIESAGMEIRFDGRLHLKDSIKSVRSYNDVAEALEKQSLSFEGILDNMVLHIAENKLKFSFRVISAALRVVTRNAQSDRKKAVLLPLYGSLDEADRRKAEHDWSMFAKLFNMSWALSAAIAKKFIYDVKRKNLGLKVTHHLMPVWFSAGQSCGKSTAMMLFLGPLEDLRTDSTLLSDLVDKRSGDIFNYPVIFIDDIAGIAKHEMPVFNSLITGDAIQRRSLGTSSSTKIKQNSMVCATCNGSVADLLPDPSGNRRLAPMPFRNGNKERGGDADVWDIVNSIDYNRLWRSVDAFGDDPILKELARLYEWQSHYRYKSPLEDWITQLDLVSHDLLSLLEPRGVKATYLHELFVRQTGHKMNMQRFGVEMAQLMAGSTGPFSSKVRTEYGFYYVPRSSSGEGGAG